MTLGGPVAAGQDCVCESVRYACAYAFFGEVGHKGERHLVCGFGVSIKDPLLGDMQVCRRWRAARGSLKGKPKSFQRTYCVSSDNTRNIYQLFGGFGFAANLTELYRRASGPISWPQ